MTKRFTDTDKWDDKWYRNLSLEHKHAWDYLCDRCDVAGVIELDSELANFRIGAPVNWPVFLELAAWRVRILESGKIWLTGFVRFQYGELKDNNNLHRSVITALEKNNIPPGDWQGVARGCPAPLVKVKEEVKEKVTPEGGCKGETKPSDVPELICGSKRLASAAGEWLEYKRERKETYKPTGLRKFLARLENVARDLGPQSVIGMLERAMGSGWVGWEHADQPARGSPRPAVVSSSTVHPEDLNGGNCGI